MRAASVAERTVPGVLATAAVLGQSRPRQVLAGACKAAECVIARVLAGSVSVAQETLVDVFQFDQERKVDGLARVTHSLVY